MNKTAFCAWTLLLAVAAVSPASAEIVEIAASKDNTLYEDLDGTLSNGAGDYFFVGTTAIGALRRGLIAFDVASAIPPGAVIDTVTLRLNMSMTIAGPETTRLHRVLADWGEGTSDALFEEGTGAEATPGDATWVHTFFPDASWSSSGGDFDADPSGSELVSGSALYFWSSQGMVADVQSWLDEPDQNFGWVVVGNEETIVTAKRFDSREIDEVSRRPVLTVDFTEAPDVPASSGMGLALLAGAVLLAGGLLVRGSGGRRQRRFGS